MEKVKYDYFVVVKKSTYLSFLYFCTWKIMRQINTNMFHFLKKYSPDYAQNTIEGWSIILVVAVGCEVSSLANSWLGMCGMFLIGALCAHIIACIIKYCITNKWFNGFITDWSCWTHNVQQFQSVLYLQILFFSSGRNLYTSTTLISFSG